ncbi:hypothetical protein KHA80_12090 [Anaerobacillus sp. HL2]|nr:hypothetical protein KHA80_12090 [Anaerobacillus sp. HL2]
MPFASISLLNLINPFINLWIGEEYLFSMPIVIVLVINFYLTGMRKKCTNIQGGVWSVLARQI